MKAGKSRHALVVLVGLVTGGLTLCAPDVGAAVVGACTVIALLIQVMHRE